MRLRRSLTEPFAERGGLELSLRLPGLMHAAPCPVLPGRRGFFRLQRHRSSRIRRHLQVIFCVSASSPCFSPERLRNTCDALTPSR
ncbi:hypothetical protein HMPREF9440_01528 [Sutterella parvirubra YIT 11816]|uniref:Uncharacterized protein n=1 Tax=Sutterella parvirubra YIT 11816 TaxID=762967 RepID=H3KFK9_9BURK|nr:hypothetical protein HMPREF9440_01528 [Sutterella parvirubra YIT 11816]